jgi:taurine dioxygenase
MYGLAIKALPGLPFGALVEQLDAAELDALTVREGLRAAWIDRGVLVVRGLPSDQATHVRLAACFGEVEVHPYRVTKTGLLPQVIDIVASDAEGDIYEVAGEQRIGWLPWHFDLCYSDRINHGGILRAVNLPGDGGETGFIDQIEAYAALSTNLQRRIEGLNVIYEMEFDASCMKVGRTPGLRLLRMQENTRRFTGLAHDLPRAIHPLVYRQQATGRPVLHLSPWFAWGIEGMGLDEGRALLDEVIAQSTHSRLAYFHRWEAGDYVVWDNWRMMHCATGIPSGEKRHLQRTAIAGDYGQGRMESETSVGFGLVV